MLPFAECLARPEFQSISVPLAIIALIAGSAEYLIFGNGPSSKRKRTYSIFVIAITICISGYLYTVACTDEYQVSNMPEPHNLGPDIANTPDKLQVAVTYGPSAPVTLAADIYITQSAEEADAALTVTAVLATETAIGEEIFVNRSAAETMQAIYTLTASSPRQQ